MLQPNLQNLRSHSSFRDARLEIPGGNRLHLPVAYSSWVRRSANVLITEIIVTCHMTHVNNLRHAA